MSSTYTLTIKDKPVTFTHLGSSWMPPFAKVTSVSVIPFTKDGQIIAIRLKHRGIDIPGGHVEPNETTPEATLRREVLEEAHMTICKPVLVEVIQSDLYGPTDEDASYMLLYAALVDELRPFRLTDEHSCERITLSREEFIGQYEAGSKELMGEAIEKAWSKLRETKS